eukprot:632948-Rhodomonas_salina.1
MEEEREEEEEEDAGKRHGEEEKEEEEEVEEGWEEWHRYGVPRVLCDAVHCLMSHGLFCYVTWGTDGPYGGTKCWAVMCDVGYRASVYCYDMLGCDMRDSCVPGTACTAKAFDFAAGGEASGSKLLGRRVRCIATGPGLAPILRPPPYLATPSSDPPRPTPHFLTPSSYTSYCYYPPPPYLCLLSLRVRPSASPPSTPALLSSSYAYHPTPFHAFLPTPLLRHVQYSRGRARGRRGGGGAGRGRVGVAACQRVRIRH